jgi:hypothetical protein
MATIEFRGKTETVHNMDGTVAWVQIKVPKLERRHCDMAAFRQHKRFGGVANSDLFPSILARIARDAAPNGYLRLDRVPANVAIDQSGFLAVVRIEA